MELIKIRGLNVSFKSKGDMIDIIRGVDIDLEPGQIIGLVGESGSGKSVTAKAILGLNEGSYNKVDYINVDGVDLKEKIENNIAPYEIRGSKVGYIPQDPMTSLNPTRTIYKQILDSINLHRPELKNEADKEKYIEDLLERFGIKNARKVYKQYPHTFSGGMRQRIAIAMMVACNPKVIIADEPTTALDTTVQAAVLELFQEIKKEGISIIFISHNIAVVAKLCDYIYVMYAGRVVEKADKKELFTNPKHPYT
jgi:oligopeptide transport system ATP-binding protein